MSLRRECSMEQLTVGEYLQWEGFLARCIMGHMASLMAQRQVAPAQRTPLCLGPACCCDSC